MSDWSERTSERTSASTCIFGYSGPLWGRGINNFGKIGKWLPHHASSSVCIFPRPLFFVEMTRRWWQWKNWQSCVVTIQSPALGESAESEVQMAQAKVRSALFCLFSITSSRKEMIRGPVNYLMCDDNDIQIEVIIQQLSVC